MSDDSDEFGLVMPFVACASNGGPYEDAPYAAGYEAGLIDVVLATLGDTVRRVGRMVRSDNVPQLDLLAMQHGWTTSVTVCEEDPSWSRIDFQRTRGVDDE